MEPSDTTVTVLNARFICEVAGLFGVDEDSLLADARLGRARLNDPDGRLDFEDEERLWQAACRMTGDERFAIRAGTRLRQGAFGTLECAVRASHTLGEAFDRLIRFARLYYEGAEFCLDGEGTTARFTHRFLGRDRGASPHASEFILAHVMGVSRDITGLAWAPQRVGFQHETAGDLEPYEQFFRAPVHFNQALNTLHFDRSMLDRELVGSNPTLAKVLDHYADQLLLRMPTGSDLVSRVRRRVGDALHGGDPGLEATARAMHMSPRTLQRRLRDDGTSHREILEGMRGELAESYLVERDLSVDQVAYLLGFTEPSAFHRAFRRWTGTTPAAYRARLTA